MGVIWWDKLGILGEDWRASVGGESLLQGYRLYAYPAGADFCSCKSQQNTLGALPQDPCRLQCWIRIDF